MVNVCAVPGCLSSARHDKDRHFYRFPSKETRRRQWIQACNRPELLKKSAATIKTYFMCDLHFKPSDRITKCLKNFAIPTLNLPQKDIANANRSKLTQTEETHSSHHADAKDAACQTDPVLCIVETATAPLAIDDFGITLAAVPGAWWSHPKRRRMQDTHSESILHNNHASCSNVETVVIKVEEEDSKIEIEDGIVDDF
ncbi:hypothetical protein O0L34_g11080 [Tuta absoluta]|nr:hypothetical protein O0L34_g11080 [Tuta absoluta]